jgi:hypothetical protein
MIAPFELSDLNFQCTDLSSKLKVESSKSLAVRNPLRRTQEFGAFAAVLQWAIGAGLGGFFHVDASTWKDSDE